MTITLSRKVPYNDDDFETGINDIKLNEYWAIGSLKKDPYDKDCFRMRFKYIPSNKISLSIKFDISRSKDRVSVYMAKDENYIKDIDIDENIKGLFRTIELMTKDTHLLYCAFNLRTHPKTSENMNKRSLREFALAFKEVK